MNSKYILRSYCITGRMFFFSNYWPVLTPADTYIIEDNNVIRDGPNDGEFIIDLSFGNFSWDNDTIDFALKDDYYYTIEFETMFSDGTIAESNPVWFVFSEGPTATINKVREVSCNT